MDAAHNRNVPSGDISHARIDFLCIPSIVSFTAHVSPIRDQHFTLLSELHVSKSFPLGLHDTYHTTPS